MMAALFLKHSLMGVLFVTCLSVSSAAADPLKQIPHTLHAPSAKNAQQQVAKEAKPDFVPIYLYSRENSLDGDYNFRYETGNGIYAEERGVMLNKGTEDEANSVVGSYRYVSPEGVPIEVTYTAGVEGFRAYGAHLPVAPPAAGIPKTLAYNKIVAPSPFGRPQFRAEDEGSDLPSSTPQQQQQQQLFGQVVDDQQATSQSAWNVATGAAPSANDLPEKPVILLVGDGQSQTATNEVEPPQKVDTFVDIKNPSAVAEYYQQQQQQQQQQPAFSPSTSPPPSQDQKVFVPSTTPLPAQQPQQRLPSADDFEQPKPAVSVVPVLQVVPQAVHAQPKVVPVLQRVVPGPGAVYQQQQQYLQQPQPQKQPLQQFHRQPYQYPLQQPYPQLYQYPLQQPYPQQQQQQQRFNARPFPPPAFGPQQRPAGSLRQFTVEPQQLWYVPQNRQQTRYFQMPPVPRTLEAPKY